MFIPREIIKNCWKFIVNKTEMSYSQRTLQAPVLIWSLKLSSYDPY